MSQLESVYAEGVLDISNNPPPTNKHETVKTEFIQRTSTSETENIQQLLAEKEMGNRTPSQFLRRLQSLAGTAISDEFMRTLWMMRLPDVMMQAILAAQLDVPLKKLADIADRIHEVTKETRVASVTPRIPTGSELITQQLQNLDLQFGELPQPHRRDRSSDGFRRRSHSRSFNGARSPAVGGQCWYHQTFGNRSTKCRPPCNFASGNLASRY